MEMIRLASVGEARCKLRLRGHCRRKEAEGTSASVELRDSMSQRISHLTGLGSLFTFSCLGQGFNYKPCLLISLPALSKSHPSACLLTSFKASYIRDDFLSQLICGLLSWHSLQMPPRTLAFLCHPLGSDATEPCISQS